MDKTKSLYAIYRYGFRRASQRDIQAEADGQDGEKNLPIAQKCFASLFDLNTIDNLAKTKRNGEVERLHNDVMAKKEDVFYWRVNDRQMKEFWEMQGKDPIGKDEYTKKKVESLPPCNVLIDNRPNACYMAIEKGTGWGQPDRVRDILLMNFNRFLSERYDIEMYIEGLYHPTDIYEFCDDRRDNHGDFIRKVEYIWKGKKANPDNVKNSSLRNMVKRTQIDHALRGFYAQEFNGKSGDTVSQKNKFTAEMVRLCLEDEGYDIVITWNDHPKYHIGDYVQAFQQIGNKVLSDFRLDPARLEGSTDLEDWFINVAVKTNDYVYESQVQKRRTK